MGGGQIANDGVSWKNYAVTAVFADGNFCSVHHGQDPFMKGFLMNLYLRPSCDRCFNKEDNRFSDLTLADYWGVQNRDSDMDDDKGTSAVLIHTQKGKEILENIKESVRFKRTDLEYVIRCNPSLAFPSPAHPGREAFFDTFGRL